MRKMRVFFSAGEVSGDLSASEVIRELTKLGVECVGIGGRKMEEAGMVNITKTDESITSSVGFVESLKFVPYKLFLLSRVKRYLKDNKPDLVFLVDNQGFNIPLARVSKELGLKVFYYFPPMVSVWGENTKYKVAKYCDKIICTFRSDYDIYKQVSDGAVYVGLPFIDRISKNYSSKDKYKNFFKEGTKKILLLPGSREQEIRTLLRPILDVVKLILSGETSIDPTKVEFYTIVAHPAYRDYIVGMIEDMKLENIVKVFDNNNDYALLDVCDLAVSASGTITLELALLKKPTIVVYKVSRLTFEIGKRLVKAKYISLPNILLGEKLFPELLQDDVNAKVIVKYIEKTFNNRDTYIDLENRIKKLVDNPGTVDRIIKIVIDDLYS